MQNKEEFDLSNYVDPYSTEYVNPYEIKASYDSCPIKVLFAELEDLLKACSESSEDDSVNKDLRIAIILPGTTQDFGKSMDAQYLYPVTNLLQTACQNLHLSLKIDAHISWECDDRTLGVEIKDQIVERHHLADLVKYFPKTERTADEDAWVEQCRTKMVERQKTLYDRAREVLSKQNLIVVGGPKVNQVMANLCHIFLINYGLLGELGMYLIPPAGTLPLKLRRSAHENKWEEWLDRTWEDRSIGWVHMIRNPWASYSNPRFLIYIGGFYAQGTPAAMLKLIEILKLFLHHIRGNHFAEGKHSAEENHTDKINPSTEKGHNAVENHSTEEKGTSAGDQEKEKRKIREYMLEQGSDFKVGNISNDYIPAHVVEAKIKLPLNWFFSAKRPGLRAALPLWSITPPAFEGSIDGFQPILTKQQNK